MKITDCRLRYGQGEPKNRERCFTSPEQALAFMDLCDIDTAVAFHNFGIYDYETANAEIMDVCKASGGRLLPGFWLDTLFGSGMQKEKDQAELCDYLCANRPVLTAINPAKQRFSLNPCYTGRLMEVLQELQLPLMLSGLKNDWNNLPLLLTQFPRLKVILFRCIRVKARYIVPLMQQFPNVYLDSGEMADFNTLENYTHCIGAERILYASGMPEYDPRGGQGLLAYAKITEEERELICGGSLRRLMSETRWK